MTIWKELLDELLRAGLFQAFDLSQPLSDSRQPNTILDLYEIKFSERRLAHPGSDKFGNALGVC